MSLATMDVIVCTHISDGGGERKIQSHLNLLGRKGGLDWMASADIDMFTQTTYRNNK